MTAVHVEYVDFTATEVARVYRLRVRNSTGFIDYTVAIPNEAFRARRLRYQDAPDICYLKLGRAIAEGEEGTLPARALSVSDEELEEYRVAHTPKTTRRS